MFELPSLSQLELNSIIKKDVPNTVLDHICYLWKLSTSYMEPFIMNVPLESNDDIINAPSSEYNKIQLDNRISPASASLAIPLSHRLSRQFIELVKANHIQLPCNVSERICSSCCVLLIPTVTSTVRLRKRTRHSKVNRRSSETKERFKNQIIEKCLLCNHMRKIPGLIRRKSIELQFMNPIVAHSHIKSPTNSSSKQFLLSPSTHSLVEQKISPQLRLHGSNDGHFVPTVMSDTIDRKQSAVMSTLDRVRIQHSHQATTTTAMTSLNCGEMRMKDIDSCNLEMSVKSNNKIYANKNNCSQRNNMKTNNQINDTNKLQNNNSNESCDIQKPKFSFLNRGSSTSSSLLSQKRRQSAPGQLMNNNNLDYIPFSTSIFNHSNIGLHQVTKLIQNNNSTITNLITGSSNQSSSINSAVEHRELNLLELEQLQKKNKKRRHTILLDGK